MNSDRVYFDAKMGCWVARVASTMFNDRPHWRLRFFATEARARQEVAAWEGVQ